MRNQVQYINAPSFPRIVNMWLKIGMIVGGVLGAGYMALENLITSVFADLLIPGIGEGIMIAFLIVSCAVLGVGALIGFFVGCLHYLIARASYNNRVNSNI